MKRFFGRFSLALMMFVAASATGIAQRQITCEEYIATYAPLAIQQQNEFGIPASIKMAQGLLESRYGNSELSRRSNNHFGIKCKSNWTGDTVRHDDDEKAECFRRYVSIEESYRDHSQFLKGSPRYASLFELDATDYKGWAHGLKTAGYATAPHYATSLIKFIEDYELYLLDTGELPTYLAGVEPVTFLNLTSVYEVETPVDINNYMVSVHEINGHGVFFNEGVRYVIARPGETYGSLARDLGLTEKRLRRYNGDKALAAGAMVLIEKG